MENSWCKLQYIFTYFLINFNQTNKNKYYVWADGQGCNTTFFIYFKVCVSMIFFVYVLSICSMTVSLFLRNIKTKFYNHF